MSFLHWYYTNGIRGAITLSFRFVHFLWRFFNIIRLTQTLFSPWKRDVEVKTWRGFRLNLIFMRFVGNIMSRCIGAIVRTITIAFGFVCIALYSVITLAILFVWITLPLFLILIPFTIFASWSPGIVFAIFSLLLIFMGTITYAYAISKQPDYGQIDLDRIQKLPWFARIYDRLEIPKEQRLKPLFDEAGTFQKMLAQEKLSADDFYQLLSWEISRQIRMQKNRFWTAHTMDRIAPIGQFWNFAYTPHLDTYCTDISATKLHDTQTLFRGNDSAYEKALIAMMRPSQNNVLLVGDAGIGKMSFIYNLTRNISEQRFTKTPLSYKRILLFNPSLAITYAINHDISIDGFLRMLFSEAAYAGNVLLVIQDLARYTSIRDGNDTLNITSLLSDFLNIPTFQIIATASMNDFHDFISKNQTLMKSFETIELQEMKTEDAVQLILGKLESVETKQVVFSFQALRSAVSLSQQYNASVPLPERALDLIEKVLLYQAKTQSDALITSSDIEAFVSTATGIPLGTPSDTEREKLLDFESILHKRIVGQKEAVVSIAETVRKIRSGITESNRPVVSFLFLGPTGVGKTETAKAFAESYFGNETRMIRLDMSEFQGENALKRFVGSRSEHTASRIASAVKDSPHSILLLDEIEKADPKVLDIFLQILDEGMFTDDFGEKISFRNIMIIATSNAGSSILTTMIETNVEYATMRKNIIEYVTQENIFRMEFLNRFNGIILFHPLDAEELTSVTKLMLETVSKSVRIKKNIDLQFEDGTVAAIINNGYEAIFGARSIRRYIETHIENIIATKIISQETAEGGSILIRPEDMKIQ